MPDTHCSTQLIDSFKRRISYLRLSVTDKCDLRCFYCLPKGFVDFQEPEEWLTFAEIERIVGVFAALGVRRLRLTGGEPLVRKDLATLAGRLNTIEGIEDLSLSTNASRLASQAGALRAAGVSRLNVSLDSLRAARFKRITGGKLDKVMAGLMAAKQAGFQPVKINMVVMRGVNEDEIEDMVEFCLEHDFTLRFIETMPMGVTGRAAGYHFYDLREARERLERRFELLPALLASNGGPQTVSGGGPARYVRVAGSELRIGFITPMSQHFCETCNRVRLSADGNLHLCLGQEDRVELRPLLRAGADDATLRAAILEGIARKPERHEFNEKPGQLVRFMSMTGG